MWDAITDWGNANAPLIQAAAAVVLVVVTSVYAFLTHGMANATQSMARETATIARLELKRQHKAVLPVLMFNVLPESDSRRRTYRGNRELNNTTHIQIINGGVGPALEARVHLTAKEITFQGGEPVIGAELVPEPEPFNLAVDASVDVELVWTPTVIISDDETGVRQVEGGGQEQFRSLGKLTVSYRDIHGRRVESICNADVDLSEGKAPHISLSSFAHRVLRHEGLYDAGAVLDTPPPNRSA